MIGVDWGTTSFRAFRIAPDGTIRDRRAGLRGIVHVPDARFGDTLRDEIGPWLAAGENHVLLSGMIGSRQGWKEAPYLPCPAGAPQVAAALVEIEFDWAQVKLVPGLSATDEAGVAEVMRGEETQVFGVLEAMGGSGLACLPGTHSKWVRVEDGRITGFTTHMTGEAFGALRGQAILAVCCTTYSGRARWFWPAASRRPTRPPTCPASWSATRCARPWRRSRARSCM
jgi:2-dehydro-3-deoxygalactonokinase